MPKLSVTIITKNEAADIGDALASVAWADEIVVVDSESADETAAIARAHTARVVVREWPGYVDQKNHAASIASHDWILSLDADERVTPALAEKIKALMARRAGAIEHAAFGSRASPGTSDGGFGRPTGTRTTSCASTTAAARSGPADTCTKR